MVALETSKICCPKEFNRSIKCKEILVQKTVPVTLKQCLHVNIQSQGAFMEKYPCSLDKNKWFNYKRTFYELVKTRLVEMSNFV